MSVSRSLSGYERLSNSDQVVPQHAEEMCKNKTELEVIIQEVGSQSPHPQNFQSAAARCYSAGAAVLAFPQHDTKERAVVPSNLNARAQVGSRPTFEDISKISLCHFQPEPQIPHSPLGDPVKFVERQKAILLGVSDRITRTSAFEILTKTESDANFSIIDPSTWKDLDLLAGSNEHPQVYIGAAISRTQSELGKSYFLGMIARPTEDLNVLRNRQSLIKGFLEDHQKLFGELNNQFTGIRNDEEQLLSFWDKKLQLPGCVNNQYFRYNETVDKFCNNSSLALEFNSAVNNLKKVTATTVQAASSILLPTYALSTTGLFASDFLQNYSIRFIGVSGALYSVASLIPTNVVKGTFALMAGTFAAGGLKSAVKWNIADFSMEAVVQNKLVAVAGYYRRMKAIHGLVSSCPEIKERLVHFDKLDLFIKKNELRHLFSALESTTFNAKAKYFFRRGNVLLAWNLMADKVIRKEFQPALTAIAEIDTILSIARLYKESQGNRVKMCFPKYLNGNKKPELALTNFWHPFVGQGAVTNSFSMGNKHAPNAIVTGPNAAGKSTVLKSITVSVILAQSIGIAPAEAMSFTPFSFVASSMNISDDLKAGKSGLQAQVRVVADLVKKRKNMVASAFSFMVLDELFTQTTAKEGSALAKATVQNLGEEASNLSIIVTHDEDLKKLEKSAPMFRNYKLSTNDQNVPLYKIEPGTSEQRIALAVAQAVGLDQNIVELARQNLQS